jgi:hypothetical protein
MKGMTSFLYLFNFTRFSIHNPEKAGLNAILIHCAECKDLATCPHSASRQRMRTGSVRAGPFVKKVGNDSSCSFDSGGSLLFVCSLAVSAESQKVRAAAGAGYKRNVCLKFLHRQCRSRLTQSARSPSFFCLRNSFSAART